MEKKYELTDEYRELWKAQLPEDYFDEFDPFEEEMELWDNELYFNLYEKNTPTIFIHLYGKGTVNEELIQNIIQQLQRPQSEKIFPHRQIKYKAEYVRDISTICDYIKKADFLILSHDMDTSQLPTHYRDYKDSLSEYGYDSNFIISNEYIIDKDIYDMLNSENCQYNIYYKQGENDVACQVANQSIKKYKNIRDGSSFREERKSFVNMFAKEEMTEGLNMTMEELEPMEDWSMSVEEQELLEQLAEEDLVAEEMSQSMGLVR